MNGTNNGPGPEIAIGGALVAIIFLVVVFKALKQIFIELREAMDAFGAMAHSLVFMLWNVTEVVFLLALIIASLCCAVFFTIQYFRMVQDAVAIRNDVDTTVESLRESVEMKFTQFAREVQIDVYRIDKRLSDALEKAKAEAAAPAPPSQPKSDDENGKGQSPSPASRPEDLDTNTEVTMSNPF